MYWANLNNFWSLAPWARAFIQFDGNRHSSLVVLSEYNLSVSCRGLSLFCQTMELDEAADLTLGAHMVGVTGAFDTDQNTSILLLFIFCHSFLQPCKSGSYLTEPYLMFSAFRTLQARHQHHARRRGLKVARRLRLVQTWACCKFKLCVQQHDPCISSFISSQHLLMPDCLPV